MTKLPSLDQYNEAVQHPRVAFADPMLRGGMIQTNGLGLPRALGGGFAITYNISAQGSSFAVRVFHKRATGLEERYRSISAELSRAPSPYFVQFEYQAEGIVVGGTRYPIVKMEWASGDTLGTYLDANHRNRAAIEVLRRAFRELASALQSRGIAHGDIQTGNVVVDGGRLRLIDYDGMFVPGMPAGNGSEIGHRHFQHPGRTAVDFGPSMDRFSVICMDVTLAALSERPELYARYATTGENILFTANDFRDPASSRLFRDLGNMPSLRKAVADFERVCRGSCGCVPDLEDFLAGRNLPASASAVGSVTASQAAYVGSLPVIDATDFAATLELVGDRVELIGRITEVKRSFTQRSQREYVFINFGDWRGKIVKVAIWSTALARLRIKPDESWKGKWISVTGLVDPPFSNERFGYTHLSVTVEEPQQLNILDIEEAKYRLASKGSPSAASRNRCVLEEIDRPGPVTTTASASQTASTTPRFAATKSRNRTIGDAIAAGGSRSTIPSGPRTSRASGRSTAPSSGGSGGCLVGVAIVVLFLLVLLFGRG